MTPSVSIVIPAFDEAKRLPRTLTGLERLFDQVPDSYEVLVVDDGSRDGTVEIARAWSKRLPLDVIALPENRGKGHAVRTGMLAARGDIRVMADADGAMPASELPRLVEAVRAGADVALGSRYVRGYAPAGQPLWRRAWSRLANGVSQLRWVPGVRDIHTGYKAFTARAAHALFSRSSLSGWAFDLEVLGLAQRAELNIVEVGIRWSDDADSRVRPWRDLKRVLREAKLLDQRLRAP